MVLDTSAIVAIELREPGHELLSNTRKTGTVSSAPPKGLASSFPHWRRAAAPFALLIEHIEQAEALFVGAPTLLESAMVLSARLNQDARPRILAFLRYARAEVVAFDERHFDVATAAFLRFGKGRHPARLNFGDCLAYAIATVAGMPLLFTGDDFAKTDVLRYGIR